MANKAVLNRPVIAQRAFDSSALSVLATIFHPFPKPGRYDVLAQSDRGDTRRFAVEVAEGGEDQVNVDLGDGVHGRSPCACDEPGPEYRLRVGGVMGFFVSRGVARYSVTITRFGEKAKELVLDSSKGLPAADLFALTLVRPGVYSVLATPGKGAAKITVELPKPDPKRRLDTGQIAVLEVAKGDIKPKQVKISSGQSVLVKLSTRSRIVVKLERDDTGEDQPRPRGGKTQGGKTRGSGAKTKSAKTKKRATQRPTFRYVNRK